MLRLVPKGQFSGEKSDQSDGFVEKKSEDLFEMSEQILVF